LTGKWRVDHLARAQSECSDRAARRELAVLPWCEKAPIAAATRPTVTRSVTMLPTIHATAGAWSGGTNAAGLNAFPSISRSPMSMYPPGQSDVIRLGTVRAGAIVAAHAAVT
jgi:hypothetical protein